MNIEVKKGSILIANPDGTDQNFMRTVVLICEHSERGALGLILNRELRMTVQEVFLEHSQWVDHNKKLFFGGPVDTNKIFYLHREHEDNIHDCKKICDGVYLGANEECFNSLLENENSDDDIFRLYLGCSCWAGGQLENEIKMNFWTVGNANENIVFYPQPDNIWWYILRSIGITDPESPCENIDKNLN